ncbi:MAG TPA: hypothetical protein PLI12_08585 [Acetobacteraceae bacterium]|nr:hypothetical protein [Acetobacteraceae bacterium]HQU02490.1 hypothetical protein [Acetobacteraceae bacterium]
MTDLKQRVFLKDHRKYLLVLAAMMVSLALTSCGRAGAPSPPGPTSALTYPHQYPSE